MTAQPPIRRKVVTPQAVFAAKPLAPQSTLPGKAAPGGPAFAAAGLPPPQVAAVLTVKRVIGRPFKKGIKANLYTADGKESASLQAARAAGFADPEPKDWKEIMRQAVTAANPSECLMKLMKTNPSRFATLAQAMIAMEAKGVIEGPPSRPIVVEVKFPMPGAAKSDFDAYAVAEDNQALRAKLERLTEGQPAQSDISGKMIVADPVVGVVGVLTEKQSWEDF